jgi:SAM-dependent methyltransferase
MITREACPICENRESTPFMTTKDFSVSGEFFSIVACQACGFHYTNPVPEENVIGNYYKSESYVSHSSSKKGLINRVYHWVRWYSLRKKVGLINKLSSGRKLLDIGAGTGHFLAVSADQGWSTVGLEPDEDARALAKTTNGVDILPLEQLHSLETGQFDVITMWHVLEHVYHLKRDAAQIVKLLKPNGTLVIAVPNRKSYDARYYKEFWAAYDLPIHLYHFTESDIKTLMTQFGLELVQTRPMIFDSFYVSMLSEKYKGGNVLKGILTGLKSNWLAKADSYSSQIYILRRKTH